MRKRRLFTPGPTPVMPEAQLRMAAPIQHHRTAEFRSLFLATRSNLARIFQTRHDVVILAASGTGAMEAAVCNLLGGKGEALAVVVGKFGQRWVDICATHNISCTAIEKDYGEAAGAEEISARLQENPAIDTVLIQACETSTGTSHDLESISKVLQARHPGVMTVVDAITGIASQPIRTDDWGLDIVISGSQKSFAMSPGLAFMSISPRALEKIERGQPRSFYFNLSREALGQREGKTAYTSAVSLVDALHATTSAILEEGLEAVIEEAATMARITRHALKAMGCCLVSKHPANAVTAFAPPEGVSAAAVSEALEVRLGVKFAGGQGPLKGKILRVAHLGYFDLLDALSAITALEVVFQQLGVPVAPGHGISAALEELSARPIGVA